VIPSENIKSDQTLKITNLKNKIRYFECLVEFNACTDLIFSLDTAIIKLERLSVEKFEAMFESHSKSRISKFKIDVEFF
jgi:hypothetical protein